jgi:hypothetical protein
MAHEVAETCHNQNMAFICVHNAFFVSACREKVKEKRLRQNSTRREASEHLTIYTSRIFAFRLFFSLFISRRAATNAKENRSSKRNKNRKGSY